MKTKIFLLSLFLGFSAYIFAQETATQHVFDSKLPGYKTNFKHSAAGENWFINISGGVQAYNLEDDQNVSFSKHLSFMPALAVGKWFTPYFAMRVRGEGFTPAYSFADGGNYRQDVKYYNVHLDAMWDLTNYWGVYSPKKLFNFTPYVGLGYAHRFQADNTLAPPKVGAGADFHRSSAALSVNPGLQFGFRLSDHVNLDFDLGMAIVGDYFDRMSHDSGNDVITHGLVGLTFKLGKTTFDEVEPMDYGLINDLNSKINALRAENNELSKRPVSCPECPPVTPQIITNVINYVPNVVFFRLNSSKIDANQQVSVYNTADFIKQTGEKIKVVGYADKGTGTSNYNLGLSEKRAKAVAKELTTKYNVPSDKITVEWKGSDEQPYPQNNWNRVVIMSAPK